MKEYAVKAEPFKGGEVILCRGFLSAEEAGDFPVVLAEWKRVWIERVGRITDSPWTEEHVARLKELWADGFSSSEIADSIGAGLSRNSVIGKLYRLDLAHSNRKPRIRPRRQPKPKLWVGRLATPKPKPKPRLTPTPKPVVVLPSKPASLHLALAELTDNTCKWPSGDGPYTFCGVPSKEDASYCEYHDWRAHIGSATQADFDKIASEALDTNPEADDIRRKRGRPRGSRNKLEPTPARRAA